MPDHSALTKSWARRASPAILTLLVMATLTASMALPVSALASRSLTRGERRDILRSTTFTGPNGRRIKDPACIAGRLSTVSRRFAGTYLSNTDTCVQRFGGASGEGQLFRRRTKRARRWKRVGSIGDNCSRDTGGASDAVLEDLGCYLGFSSDASSLALGALRLPPDRVSPLGP